MKREIKFRGWITTTKHDWFGVDNFDTFDWDNRMRQVSSIHFPLSKPSGKDITCEPICEDDNYASAWFGSKYKDYILMQYTGLKDSNGVEIYEGDIVKTGRGNFQVFWNTPSWDLHHETEVYSNGDYYMGNEPNHHQWNTFTVIGNIHQNPELIK